MLDLGIYLSAFQPFTEGDAEAIRRVAAESRHILLLIGSSNRPVSVHAPFDLPQRRSMVDATLPREGLLDNVTVCDLPDYPGNDEAWGQHLRDLAQAALADQSLAHGSVGIACLQGRGALSAAVPDEWIWIDTHDAPMRADAQFLRRNMLEGGSAYRKECPGPVASLIDSVRTNQQFQDLVEDQKAIDTLREKYGPGPFHAVDVVVRKGSKVLVIRRGNRPNRGVLAFPGGIIDPGETPIDAARRELGEETNLGNLLFGTTIGEPVPFDPEDQRYYDDPRRDPRYHMTTTAFLWTLPDDGAYPLVTGHDDAASDDPEKPGAEWIDIQTLRPEIMWADHGFILKDLIR